MRKSAEYGPINLQSKYTPHAIVAMQAIYKKPLGSGLGQTQRTPSHARLVRTRALDIVAPILVERAPFRSVWCIHSNTNDLPLVQL